MRFLTILTCVFLVACSAPTQYTMIQPGGVTTQRGAIGAWPSLSSWKKADSVSKDAAVIIAIEDYAFLPDVKGAIRNANDWEEYFRSAKGMENVFVLTDQNAPIEEISRFTKQAVDSTQEGGTTWFVFIGHGAANKEGTDGLLVGMDAQQTMDSIASRSLAKKDLVALLQKENKKAVMVLDTCFSGKSASGELLATGTQPVIPIIKPTVKLSGFTILSAAKADQVAGQLPNEERPAFSYLLLGALRGWASDGDAKVTTKEAIQYTASQLRLVKGRQQTPNLEGEGDFVLSSNATEKDPGIKDLIQGRGKIITTPNSTEGVQINTNEGVTIPKLEGWAVSDTIYPGIIFVSSSMLYPAELSISKMEMDQMYAASAMQSTPQMGMGETLVEKPTPKTYGKTTGVFYRSQIPKDNKFDFSTDESLLVFRTYQNGALWLFRMEYKSFQIDEKIISDFERFISEASFQ